MLARTSSASSCVRNDPIQISTGPRDRGANQEQHGEGARVAQAASNLLGRTGCFLRFHQLELLEPQIRQPGEDRAQKCFVADSSSRFERGLEPRLGFFEAKPRS
jgi:hypothetical protein